MLKTSLLPFLLSFGLLFQACSNSHEDKNEQVQKANKMVATNKITLQTLDNNPITLEKTSTGFILEKSPKKLILIDVFATWCPPCQAEASHLASLQKKFPNTLQVLGVTIEDNIPNANLENFKQQFQAEYTFVNSVQNRVLINALADQLKLETNFGIPLMALFKDGKLINYYQGITEEEFLENDIKHALGKQ